MQFVNFACALTSAAVVLAGNDHGHGHSVVPGAPMPTKPVSLWATNTLPKGAQPTNPPPAGQTNPTYPGSGTPTDNYPPAMTVPPKKKQCPAKKPQQTPGSVPGGGNPGSTYPPPALQTVAPTTTPPTNGGEVAGIFKNFLSGTVISTPPADWHDEEGVSTWGANHNKPFDFTTTPNVLPATADRSGNTYQGLGTMYGGYGGKGACLEEDCWQGAACGFKDYKLPKGIDGSTCLGGHMWMKGANCGRCINVNYVSTDSSVNNTMVIMVTNATGGNGLQLDMTPNTFHNLTGPNMKWGGVPKVTWHFIDCPVAPL